MSSKVVISAGRSLALTVYDDRWRLICEAVGSLSVSRASEVEFDAGSGEWVARLVGSGLEVARGRSRAAVIRAEVEYLESNLGGV